MKLTVKKSISMTLMLAVLTSAVVLPAKRAEAIVGLATANPIVAILGLAATAGSAAGIVYADVGNPDLDTGLSVIFSSMAGGIVGLTLLDDQDSQDVAFAPLSADSAKTIGLSDAELAAYNDQLDAINLIRENVASQVQNESKQDVVKASSLWTQYQDDLSPAAFAAVQKVAQAAVKNAAARQ
jgi:hypothetical protein